MNKETNSTKGRYMDLLTDFAFKTLLGQDRNKALLIDFLNVLINRPDKITDIQYLPTEHLGRTEKDRKAIFDIHCVTSNQEWYIIEMQVARQEHFLDRCLFYSTFPIQKQAKRGKKWDYKLETLYHVAILNFKYFDDEYYISHLSLHREETKAKVSSTQNIIIVELPGFKKRLQELENRLDQWLYCFKHMGRLENQPEEISGNVFKQLYTAAELNNLTPEDMELYDKSLVRDREVINMMDYSRKEGRLEGEKTGRTAGIELVAKKLLDLHFPVTEIAQATGLTTKQIRSL
ncbi:MAG: hypothetical protein EZS26_002798 [Candidatus Ordinivivax streblomastigis]|uniref:Rpn family recombination-promoting nuclease/putative transposase n=1 Tax=Candidatus Ordinivivax streblomastigis TaxID=2540710 RepID=A0A5M8NYP4_9BACT|nr:MAG: hypothetical protein EZS26_002798 [Candidatus Ordinivivax streblomastigis]